MPNYIIEPRATQLKFPHSIAIGTPVSVEVALLPEYNGEKLYVTNHSRDCDGTPLYDLHQDKEQAYKMRKLQEMLLIVNDDEEMAINAPTARNELMEGIKQQMENIRRTCETHFSDDCLIVHRS